MAEQDDSRTLRIPTKHVPRFDSQVGMVGERGEELASLSADADPNGPDTTDQIPNFGETLRGMARDAGIPSRQVNAAAKRQRIGRNRLGRLVAEAETADIDSEHLDSLRRAVAGDVVWDRIESVETIESDH